MTIQWSRETLKDRTISGKSGEGSVYRRSFLVRVDDPTESQADIVNSCGVAFGDAHPDDNSCRLKTFDCKPVDSDGLLYAVTFEYSKPDLEDNNDSPGSAGGALIPTWSASSSVTTGPAIKDINGNMILNSAGDPLEGLEKENAEFRLTLTQYFTDHTTWVNGSREYTNTTNNAQWNGGAAGEWKCQGSSAKLNIDNSDQTVLVYWEVNIEFAYRKGGWDLKVNDIGFHQKVGDDGQPSGAATKRARIKGQDGKPVAQPVGLCGGVAVAVGQPPCELFFQIYERKDFNSVFGQVYTPTAP